MWLRLFRARPTRLVTQSLGAITGRQASNYSRNNKFVKLLFAQVGRAIEIAVPQILNKVNPRGL